MAFNFNMSIQLLKSLNHMLSDDVYPGQVLKIINKGENNLLPVYDSEDDAVSSGTNTSLNNIS